MSFINPLFLFGLLAISIPILVHLFNFRRYRRVLFSNTKFIEEIKLETRRRSKLKHLIILLMRIIAVAALVLAFAQPYIPSPGSSFSPSASGVVTVWIDNSFSMEATSSEGRLLDEARNKAAEIASAYRASDRFMLITNDFEGKHRRIMSRDEFQTALEDVDVTPVVRKYSEVLLRHAEGTASLQNGSKHLYCISDFQKSISDFELAREDSSVAVFLIPLFSPATGNLYIDSCWFSSPVHRPGMKAELNIRIRNRSGEAVEKVPLKLTINGAQRAVSSISAGPYSELTTTLTYQESGTGIQAATIEITDNPVVFDDRFYFSYRISGNTGILCLNGSNPSPYLNALFAGDSAFTFVNAPLLSADYSTFRRYTLIILNEAGKISDGLAAELAAFLGTGASVLVIPPADGQESPASELFRKTGANGFGKLVKSPQSISYINLRHPIFTGVFDRIPENIDLPKVFAYYSITRESRSVMADLLKLQNGESFLSEEKIAGGRLYLLASPLKESHTGFHKHAVFVPSMYQIALLSQPSTRLFYMIGTNDAVEIAMPETKNSEDIIRLKRNEDGFEIVPGQTPQGGMLTIHTHDQLSRAGHYSLMLGQNTLEPLAYNYDRSESDLSCYSLDELKKIISMPGRQHISIPVHQEKATGEIIAEMNTGTRLWKYFIILALIMLGGEIFILRFWK